MSLDLIKWHFILPGRPAEYQGRAFSPFYMKIIKRDPHDHDRVRQPVAEQNDSNFTLVIQEVMPLPFHATESDAYLQARGVLSVAFGLLSRRLQQGQRGT